MRKLALVLVCSVVAIMTSRVEAATIEFSDTVFPNPFNVPVTGYFEGGFKITASDSNAFIMMAPFKTMAGGSGGFLSWNTEFVSAGSLSIIRDNPLNLTPFSLDSLVFGTLDSASPVAKYKISSTSGMLTGDAGGLLNSFSGLFTNQLALTIEWTGGSALAIDKITLSDSLAPVAVPEPASTAILGLGCLGMVVRRLRRRNTVIA